MRILALQLKRIGDLILTVPALSALKAALPGAHITLAVHPSTAGLLPALPPVDAAIVVGPGWTPWQQVLTGGYEAVLDFTGSDRAALLAALSRAGQRIAFAQVRKRRLRALAFNRFVESSVRERHTVDYYTDLAAALAPSGQLAAGPSALQITPASRTATQALLAREGVTGPYAILHAGSARAEKYWLPQRWAELAKAVRARGLTPIFTGGTDPFEREHLAAIKESLAYQAPLFLDGQLTLEGLAALISAAALVISVDTAVVHLAAAFERPQIALFGPTNPFHWRPRHSQAVVFSAAQPDAPLTTFQPRAKGAPMERLSTAPIIRATDALLSSP